VLRHKRTISTKQYNVQTESKTTRSVAEQLDCVDTDNDVLLLATSGALGGGSAAVSNARLSMQAGKEVLWIGLYKIYLCNLDASVIITLPTSPNFKTSLRRKC